MRLNKLREFLDFRQWKYEYNEEDGCGSIDFEHGGLMYYIWEFDEGEKGVESNVQTGGKQEEFFGDYEDDLIKIMQRWR